jgi:hypothetical protein
LVIQREVMFYTSDQTGNEDHSGAYLWRAVRDQGQTAWQTRTLLMDHVASVAFTYAPSIELRELVQVSMTVGEGEQPGYYTRTEVSEVYVSNH